MLVYIEHNKQSAVVGQAAVSTHTPQQTTQNTTTFFSTYYTMSMVITALCLHFQKYWSFSESAEYTEKEAVSVKKEAEFMNYLQDIRRKHTARYVGLKFVSNTFEF